MKYPDGSISPVLIESAFIERFTLNAYAAFSHWMEFIKNPQDSNQKALAKKEVTVLKRYGLNPIDILSASKNAQIRDVVDSI